MSLAYHNLFQDKLRSTLSIVGVRLAIVLILILNGFLIGVDRTAATYLEHAPNSVVVARQDVKSFIASSSLLPPGITDAVSKIEGVAKATPILTQPVYFELHGQKQFVDLIGYDSRSPTISVSRILPTGCSGWRMGHSRKWRPWQPIRSAG